MENACSYMMGVPVDTVIADKATGRTKKLGVWAGGDVVTGSATVISAMGAAKRAAADIDRYLRGTE
jgi:glutamate synthase (NADPH/NADH) small chain